MGTFFDEALSVGRRSVCLSIIVDGNEDVSLVGPIDDHQHQSLRMLPRLGLVRTQLDDLLVTFPRRATGWTCNVRRGPFFEHRVGLDSPEKTELSLGQPVEHFAVHVARVDGDPFEYTTHCVGVMMEGKIVSEKVQ